MIWKNVGIIFLFLIFFSGGKDQNCREKEYMLDIESEEYNTRYFFTMNFTRHIAKDMVLYVDDELPSSFVIEVGALNEGEKSLILYDDTKEILVEKKHGKYRINGKTLCGKNVCQNKISFYFVNNKVVVYLDEKKRKSLRIPFDSSKRIGIKWSKSRLYSYKFFYCYEPVPFKIANYGEALDDGVVSNVKEIRLYPHNVGEKYSLSFPSDITKNSNHSMRFEYRYENARAEGKNKMKRGRSEISGVFCSSPMNKWIIEYDLYVPFETVDDPNNSESITQLHESSSTAIMPAFVVSMQDGRMTCKSRGDSTLISQWRGSNPSYQTESIPFYISKNRWYHVKIFVKEGYQVSSMPLTKVWVDGRLVFDCRNPNCYNYEASTEGLYNYLKFGVYKSSWLRKEEKNPLIWRRIYYFDNYIVRY